MITTGTEVGAGGVRFRWSHMGLLKTIDVNRTVVFC